ncbi:MAG: FeoB-associated Cys-rich membrane protein [Clostridiales bacterium]|nr:FeoB-associated Cys-rich membrane protein [Clostridiales bacterium]
MGDVAVLLVIVGLVVLAFRTINKNKKSCCSGCCASCGQTCSRKKEEHPPQS